MSYQLANEPRAMRSVAAYRRWIAVSAALIKRLSPEHLITTGSEGRTPFAFSYVGLDPASDHAIEGVDYMTIHVCPSRSSERCSSERRISARPTQRRRLCCCSQVWPQNWEWYDPYREATIEPAINRSLAYIRCAQPVAVHPPTRLPSPSPASVARPPADAGSTPSWQRGWASRWWSRNLACRATATDTRLRRRSEYATVSQSPNRARLE